SLRLRARSAGSPSGRKCSTTRSRRSAGRASSIPVRPTAIMSTSNDAEASAPAGGSVARVIADAAARGLDIEVLELAAGTRTAEDAARTCGCGIDQIVKSIVFRVTGGDRHVLFLTAGGN